MNSKIPINETIFRAKWSGIIVLIVTWIFRSAIRGLDSRDRRFGISYEHDWLYTSIHQLIFLLVAIGFMVGAGCLLVAICLSIRRPKLRLKFAAQRERDRKNQDFWNNARHAQQAARLKARQGHPSYRLRNVSRHRR